MVKYTLEILSSSKKPFKPEGIFYLEGEGGEGERVEIRGLVRAQEKASLSSFSKSELIIAN